MNKAFLKYLQEKCMEPQLLMWTWLYTQTDDRDVVAVGLLDLRLRFKHSPKVFARVLAIDEMQGRQFITYRQIDKSTIEIKFNKNYQIVQNQLFEISKGNDKTLINSNENQVKEKKKVEKAELKVITIDNGNGKPLEINPAEQKEISPVRQTAFSIALKDMLVDDYIAFFQSVQRYRASVAGLPDASVLPPKIDGADIAFFKKLTAYFRSIPRKTGKPDPLTDDEVRACFRKIYSCWESFDQFIQNGIKPQQIWFNINNIIIQISGPQTDKIQKRENEYRKAAHEAGSRDYSHLLKK